MGPDTPGPAPAMSCHVVTERQGGFVLLHGEIVSERSASGTYRLQITKESASGISRISQSGTFSALPGTAARAGEATLNFDANTRIEARLTVDARGHVITCRIEERSHD